MAKITLAYLRQLIDDINTAGPVPGARTISINGSTQDLSANRTYTVTDANLSTSDITTNNSSTTKHGFLKKLSNVSTEYMDGTGAWSTPPSGATNLAIANVTGTTLDITSSTGTDATIPAATITDAGLLIATDKVKLNNTSGTNTGDQTTVSGNAGTATTLQTARKINGVSFNGSADIGVDDSISLYNAMGGVIVCNPIFGDVTKLFGTLSLSNQRLQIIAYWLEKGQTITGIKFYQVTQGDYTANNNNKIGICSYSAGTLTLERSSTDDGTLWKGTSGTWQSKAFSSTFTASAAGLYFAFAIYCRSAQVTAPTIAAYSTGLIASSLGVDFTNSGRLNATLAGQTDLPATQALSGTTLSATAPGLFLY